MYVLVWIGVLQRCVEFELTLTLKISFWASRVSARAELNQSFHLFAPYTISVQPLWVASEDVMVACSLWLNGKINIYSTLDL